MKKEVFALALMVALGSSLFSGCVHFKTVQEGQAFLAASKAASTGQWKTVHKTSGAVYSPPLNTAKSVAIVAAGAPLTVVGITGKIASNAAVMLMAKSPIQDMWILGAAETWYDHYVVLRMATWEGDDDRNSVAVRAIDRAVAAAGELPPQCEIVPGWANDRMMPFYDVNGKSLLTGNKMKVLVDKNANTAGTLVQAISYSVAYRTKMPEGAEEGIVLPPEQLCTKEMVTPHWEKVVEYMQSQ